MDYNATKLFISIVQAGSLSAASEKTGVPISTLSRKMNELERDLAVQLLERSKLGVKLTAKGQEFFKQVQVGIELLQQAQQTVQSEHKLQGKLRLSLPPAFDWWWDLLMAFQRQYPDIQVFCHAGERVVDLFEDGIDVALRIGELHTDDVIAKPIGEVRRIWAASPEFIAQYGTPKTPADLPRFALVGWANTDGSRNTRQIGGYKFKPEFVFASNDSRALLHYALAGMAIGEFSDLMARPYLASGELVQILPDYADAGYPLHLIYAAHRQPSAIVRAYVDFCAAWLNG